MLELKDANVEKRHCAFCSMCRTNMRHETINCRAGKKSATNISKSVCPYGQIFREAKRFTQS